MKHPIIRTIYLYLFALVGLVMVTIGGAQLVQLGLKVYVFTKADIEQYRSYPSMPPSFTLDKSKTDVEAIKSCADKCGFTAEQKAQIDQWLIDYQTWQTEQKGNFSADYANTQRSASHQRDAAEALGLIIIGLPLYLYHWSVIKRDRKDDKSEI